MRLFAIFEVVPNAHHFHYFLRLYYFEKHSQWHFQVIIQQARFEQLYPLPQKQIEKLKKKYAKAEWVWAQEEPENMGPWSHIMRHVPTIDWHYVGRNESASPAVGSSKVHAKQQDELVSQAFSKLS